MPEQKPRTEWPDGQRMVYDLIKAHPEIFKDVPSPQDILFVLDTVNEPTSKGKPLMIRISKITDRVVDFIDAGEKSFMLEWFQRNNGYLTVNKCYLLLAQQLLRFESNGDGSHKIAGYDIEEMELVAERFGYGWAGEQKGDVADILSPYFEWGRVGQSRIQFVQEQRELDQAKEQAATARRREQAEQATLPLTGGINLLPTEFATLNVPASGEPTLTITGPEGTRQVPAVTVTATADGWQPDKPYALKDNVRPFIRPTGTDEDR